jgi:hypothetical protein
MHCRAGRNRGKLLLEANEADHRAIRLEPCGSAAWAPPSLAGSLIGCIKGRRVQILNCARHSGGIYGGHELLQD